MSCLERASAQLSEALNNFMAAVAAELVEARSTVAPHSHFELVPSEASSLSEFMDAVFGAASSAASPPAKDMASAQAAGEPAAAPAAVSPSERKPVVFTTARLAMIERDYTTGVPIADIFARISALPGAPLTDPGRIAIVAAKRGWRRPPAAKATPGAAQPGSSAPKGTATISPPPAAQATKPPPPKTAPKAASAPIDLNCWTPARLQLAQPMYETGAPLLEIAVAANGLNGPIVTIQKIQVLAAARGWIRGTAKLASAEPVLADDAEIRHWAGQRGIIAEGRTLPLELINAKRLALGLPPFQRATPQRGRAA